MATKKAPRALDELRASVLRMQREGERIVSRIRRDTRGLVLRSRAAIVRDVRAVRREIGRRAEHTVRDFEARVVRQFHAATTARVARLERRVTVLEKQVAELERQFAEAKAA